MKTERRHELKTNELADFLGHRVENLKPYAKLLSGVILAAIVLVTTYFVLRNRGQQAAAEDWNEYFAALAEKEPDRLQQLIEDRAGSDVARCAHLLLGDRSLSHGIDLLFTDHAKANGELAAAVEHFRAAAEATDPFVQQRATFGLARAYESQPGKLEYARTEYRRLAETWPEGAYAAIARERLADLETDATKQFYDWFNQETSQPRDPEEGLPDLGPDFDLTDPLPDLGLPPVPRDESSNDGDRPSGDRGSGEIDLGGGRARPSADGDEAEPEADDAADGDDSAPSDGQSETGDAPADDPPEGQPAADAPAADSSEPP